MENYVNKTIGGRYEVREIIGVGSMSVTYKAYDIYAETMVAVKILRNGCFGTDAFRVRYYFESATIKRLSHPNIAKVYAVHMDANIQYIVMEYVDSITLQEYMNKFGAITWNDALYFWAKILDAVQYAHSKGIVHRNIKPQNIMLLRDGDIKVTDFGLACSCKPNTEPQAKRENGNSPYLSPEQLHDDYADEKSDIFSLGVLLYEMLMGTASVRLHNFMDAALLQVYDASENDAAVPLGLLQICVHAMQENPLDRYATVTQMIRDADEVRKNPKAVFDFSSKPKQKTGSAAKKSHVSIFKKNKKAKPVPVAKDESDTPTKIKAPYAGNKKYIFISYSHKNENTVMKLVRQLQNDGYRVWYDKDNAIKPATEYNAVIEERLEHSYLIIAFVTPMYFESSFCRDELLHARSKEKRILLAYLQDTPLPVGFNMRFSSIQYIKRSACDSDRMFYLQLRNTDGITDCMEKH